MKQPHPIKNQKSKIENTTDWSDVAHWYDNLVGEAGSDYHQHVVLPGALRLLNPQPSQKILDLACGQGVLCRLLSQRGAFCTGVDASPDLIKLARDRNSGDKKREGEKRTDKSASSLSSPEPRALNPEPSYIVGDARNLSFLSESHFDSAACILAVQNIHPLQPMFLSAARVLKPNGQLVIVMMHPHFRSPKETSWGWDEEKKVQYRRIDRYLIPRKHPITAHPGQKSSEYTWSFHKPLSDYVKFLRNAGFLIDALEEWPSHKQSTSGPRAGAENQARKDIPLFLALRALKVATPSSIAELPDQDQTPIL
jgi:ubiquinone/menaquinone biosynthesis C-methylase UbiE